MTEALDQLSALAGIEEGWWDFFGTYRKVPDDTKKAFLAAMGFAVESDEAIRASLHELETRPWRRWLEPVTVWREQDGAPQVSVTVEDRREDARVVWTLEEENGARHQGEFHPRALRMSAEREAGGEWRRRHQFTLPGMPLPGVHRLSLSLDDGLTVQATLIVTPARAYQPDRLEQGGRLWGYATQLYALRSPENWGIGDFSDLARLGRRAAAQGAAAIGVNPLHALFPTRPDRYSPYSPSARRFVNIIYIDVEAVPDFKESVEARRLFASPGFQARLAAAQNARLVDYQNIGPMKLSLLDCCWHSFRDNHLDNPASERGQAFHDYQREGGPGAERFAVFETLEDHFTRQGLPYWRQWPQPYQTPDSPEVAEFVRDNRDRVEFFWYLQWLADGQLAAAQAACRDAGMALGIYRDLGVGIGDDGAEAWANQSLLCLGVSVGAPPDPLNLAGQDWGLVPFNPIALREAAYAPLLEVLEANMAHAGAMRLDHAMSLQRLYWVPRGARSDQGAYVRYPAADLFNLVVLASRRRHCLVIGEDLGTVPDGFREHMDEMGILGYRLAVFEKKEGGLFKSAGEIQANALVGVGTHDLPSLPGWWRGQDIDERRRLNVYPDPAMAEEERQGRTEDRRQMVAMLAREDLLPADFPVGQDLSDDQLAQLTAALYRHLDRSPSKLLMVQFEDVLGLPLQMNLPGTIDQHPNWRRRYPQAVEEMMADPRLAAAAESLRDRA